MENQQNNNILENEENRIIEEQNYQLDFYIQRMANILNRIPINNIIDNNIILNNNIIIVNNNILNNNELNPEE
jgi:hypothetical protein